jgi:phage terminase Nu1 subunit (DNA packaging protein)
VNDSDQIFATDQDARPQGLLLGEPLAIDKVARLLGCSVWTIRQRYLRQGLPYLQASRRGKLVFFREQVIAWIQKRQHAKGGMFR